MQILDTMIADTVRAAAKAMCQALVLKDDQTPMILVDKAVWHDREWPRVTWTAMDRWGKWTFCAVLSDVAGSTRWQMVSVRLIKSGVDTRKMGLASWSTLAPAAKDEMSALLKKHQASDAYKAARKTGNYDKYLNKRAGAPDFEPEAEVEPQPIQAPLF
jgi:hypothetical protein